MRVRACVLAGLLLVGAACQPGAGPARTASSPPAHTQTVGGCGSTRVFVGVAPPEWSRAGFSVGAGNWTLPWALSAGGSVVAHLFARQLVAKGERPDGSANKVLWVARDVSGSLTVVGHPAASAEPQVTIAEQMTNGNQMPSIVDVPTPGCWSFDVGWGTPASRDSLSLQVLPAGTNPSS